jgi:hypothetical protein
MTFAQGTPMLKPLCTGISKSKWKLEKGKGKEEMGKKEREKVKGKVKLI